MGAGLGTRGSEMEIRKLHILRGPNFWAKFPVLEAWVDLGEFKDLASSEIPGFNDRMKSWLPSLIEHRCSEGERGGFFARLERGTYLAHILEHVTLELQSLAGTTVGFGRARETGEDGVYKVAIEFEAEKLGKAALETGRRLCLAAVLDHQFEIAEEIEKLRVLKRSVCPGPSTAAILNAAKARDIPIRRLNEYSLYQLGHGAKLQRIQASETSLTPAIAEAIAQDKQLTRDLLYDIGAPVPEGYAVDSVEEAIETLEYFNHAPVVVKPRYGNQGRGVAVNLSTREQVREAYESALKESSYIVVEKYAPGFDHRLLVVGGKLVAAALREPPHIFGDGRSTVRQLVEEINQDPRRTDDHGSTLSKIPLDEIAVAVLDEQGLTLDAVPERDRRVLLRRNGNLSTGGTATDVTDLVHPSVAAWAVAAARVVGLDIAGVDIVVEDIGQPLEGQGGVIVEVNAGPGLRMHVEPATGAPRPVGEAIIAHLFPHGETGRIPIVGVTGTNGKTTTTRLIAAMLSQSGKTVGMTCSDGIEIGGKPICKWDCSGPQSARSVLSNPAVEAGVFEIARGGILREGLAFDRCDLAVMTNIGEGDHLGIHGIDTPERMAYVKRTLTDAVAADGHGVFNAADPLTVEAARHCPGKVIFFARSEAEPALAEHKAKGGKVAFTRGGSIILAQGEREIDLANLANVPVTHGGAVAFQIENALAAAAGAWGLGVPLDDIRKTLFAFRADAKTAPGRFNVIAADGATVILDYAHNPSAQHALIESLGNFAHSRRAILYSVAGDRRDAEIVRQSAILGDHFDVIYTYEGDYNRGRASGEIFALMRNGIEQGSRTSEIVEIVGEENAVRRALEALAPGDLLVIQVGKIEKIIAMVMKELALHHSDPLDQPPVEVRRGRLGQCVYAAREIEPGDCIISTWGRPIEYRTRHSIQVDHDRHIIVGPPMQLMNHSCDPNCGVLIKTDEDRIEIHALKPIAGGEELTIDYCTFESEILFMPGKCLCGSQACRGKVTGYGDLSRKRREYYGEYIAGFLRDRKVSSPNSVSEELAVTPASVR